MLCDNCFGPLKKKKSATGQPLLWKSAPQPNPTGYSQKLDQKGEVGRNGGEKSQGRWAPLRPPTASPTCKETQAENSKRGLLRHLSLLSFERAKPHTRTRVHARTHTHAHRHTELGSPNVPELVTQATGPPAKTSRRMSQFQFHWPPYAAYGPGRSQKSVLTLLRHRRPSVFKHTSTEP